MVFLYVLTIGVVKRMESNRAKPDKADG